MSLLSTKLRWYIEESGYTVYQLAKLTGVDRTSIQKTLSGQRLISEESMMCILKHLHLTTREREELLKYYEISKVGDNIYFRREYIRSIIEGLALVRQVGRQDIDIHGEVKVLSGLDQENQLFVGEYAVINLLRVLIEDEVFNQERPELGIYIPLKEEFLNHIFPLYQLDGESIFKKMSVTQLLRFTKTVDRPEDSHYNLRILNMILPYSLAAGTNYKVYYYYSSFSPSNDDGLIFPYYIIFSSQVVFLSSGLDSAMLCRTKDVLRFYKNAFLTKIRGGGYRLAQQYSGPEALLSHLNRKSGDNSRQYWLEFQPCISSFGDEEMAESLLRPETEKREELLAAVNERIRQLKSFDKPYCFFLEKGLKIFAETGIITEFPAKYLRPCTEEERICLLEQLWEACSSETQILRVIDETVFKVPDFVTIAVTEGLGLNISVSDGKDGSTDIFITETTLWQAFVDFIVSLKDSLLVSSKEETLNIIEGYINRLKNKG